MEKIKKSMVAKIIIYIFMLSSFVVASLSAITIIFILDSSGGSYYIGDDNGSEFYEDMNETAVSELHDMMLSSLYRDEIYFSESSDEEDMIEILKDTELISGEDKAEGWGYTIYGANGAVLKTVNPNIVKDEENENVLRTVYSAEYPHEGVKIEIYINDEYHENLPGKVKSAINLMQTLYAARYVAIAILAVMSIAAVILMILMIKAVGNEKDKKWQRIIPLDLLAFVTVIIIVAVVCVFCEFFPPDALSNVVLSLCSFAAVAAVVITTFILISAMRIKQGSWWKSTIIYIICVIFKKIILKAGPLLLKGVKNSYDLICKVPVVWKSATIFGVCSIINIILLSIAAVGGVAFAVIMWIIGAVLTGAFILGAAFKMKKLKEGAEHIAAGELDYRIDETGMYFDIKSHAETLNRIGEGLSLNVEEKLKSERMKTELVTNVSHDIKTPLTSIINYIDFLKKEEIENEKAAEYIEVIDRQSQRLKKLTEDLVEVSKAATGNIKLELSLCDAGVMMNQLMGEYKEKAETAGLEFVVKMPQKPVHIMADGRRMWRVLDNIMSNICKYSQSGTRVYQSLEVIDDKAVMSYKNISKYELDISAEELTERFVRGDKSRHTDGSGLGLSIAKNLTELQGGILNIDIDGDLFKVIIEFPIHN